MKFIPLPGQYFQLHDQCPRFWSSVDWETLLQWKLILDALHLRFLAASWSHNGQRKFCHCFQAIALIRMSQYNLPTYLKSTIPTYDFTIYPLYPKDTNLHHSYNFSTSPIPQLPKRSMVQHSCKRSYHYTNLGDR